MSKRDHRPKLLLVGCRPDQPWSHPTADTSAGDLGFEIEHAADLGAALRILRTQDVDLILLNPAVTGAQGPSALAPLREARPLATILTIASEQGGSQAPGVSLKSSTVPEKTQPTGAADSEPGRNHRCPDDGELLRNTLEALTYPFYIINVDDYTLAAANRAAVGSPGSTPSDVTCYGVTHKRDSPCSGKDHPCPLQRVAASGEPVTVEHVHYDEDGEARHVEVHGYPIFDEEGDLVQMIEYTWDITDRRLAERALRRERDLVARLMETSPVSITMANRRGEIVFANARAEAVLGLSKEEITSRTYDAPNWRITSVDGGPFAESDLPFRRVMATRQPVYDIRHAIEWPDGRRRILSINGAPLRDPSGDVERVVFAIEDVTEQVLAERERIRQIEVELRRLEDVAALAAKAVSAHTFGLQPLREALPRVFQSLRDTYAPLLDQALDQRAYRSAETDMQLVHELAERLGALGATPRDVVDVHVAALKTRNRETNPIKAEAYASEGRLVALRVMGELVSYYRRRCANLRPPTSAGRREAANAEGTGHHE